MDRDALDRLYRYCLALTRSREDALDLQQSSIERYLESEPQQLHDPAAYIRRIARNQFYDRLRRDRVVAFEPMEDPERFPGLERDLEQAVVDELTVAELWRGLGPHEREVVYLWAVEGYSTSEIALQLGQPRGTVLARLNRLRKRLASRGESRANGGRQ